MKNIESLQRLVGFLAAFFFINSKKYPDSTKSSGDVLGDVSIMSLGRPVKICAVWDTCHLKVQSKYALSTIFYYPSGIRPILYYPSNIRLTIPRLQNVSSCDKVIDDPTSLCKPLIALRNEEFRALT